MDVCKIELIKAIRLNRYCDRGSLRQRLLQFVCNGKSLLVIYARALIYLDWSLYNHYANLLYALHYVNLEQDSFQRPRLGEATNTLDAVSTNSGAANARF